ncbi:MAG: endolytic transglycosylase MltG [Solirubrobacterales bacterium]|nr:endolytic transglycosylase MltG [Solirubrobacterales bacterium]
MALLALLVGVAVIWFLAELFQPFHGSGHGSVTVTVPPHSSSSKVGDLLERDGVVSSSFFFELRATLGGDRSKLRSGTYHLQQGMSYGAALKVLTTPPPVAPTTELTIVEGRTRQQIDALLRSQGVSGSYRRASRRSPLLDPHAYGAPRGVASLEGFLFPSTYQLRKPIDIHALIADQLRTFRQQFATVKLGYARRKGMTPYDVLTIASMVQAEAQTSHDAPLVASVIYNRLAAGMPLQIDATTRYAVNNFTSPLTVAQLNSPSPYNTRIRKGLPPTPINNPGLAAIQAAANPRITNYLYFVVKPCGNGEHVFATNYQAFLAATKRYQSARTQRGGRSPAQC